MADFSVNPESDPRKVPARIHAALAQLPDAIAAQKDEDPEFWLLHSEWRALAAAHEGRGCAVDEGEGMVDLLDRASAARDAMFLAPVSTASALLVKMEACAEGGADSVIATELRPGVDVFAMLRWDCERVMKRELGLGPVRA